MEKGEIKEEVIRVICKAFFIGIWQITTICAIHPFEKKVVLRVVDPPAIL